MKNTIKPDIYADHFYLDILENLFLCVFVNDVTGKTIYTNPAVIRHYGITPAYLITTYPEWGFWEGIVFPPAYKQLMKEKRTVFYNQLNLITNKCHTTISTPVMKTDASENIEFMVQIIQEDFSTEEVTLIADNPKNLPDLKTDLIGQNHFFCNLIKDLEKIANSDMPILLLGESGTGKTYIAQYIHNYSHRHNKPFRSVNCGAIPSNLLESELFGYTPGSFTGANTKGKRGLFELVEGGTLFLDEIGDMPIDLQVKILHVLEDGKFIPVGSTVPVHSNVRIITATNKDLKKCMKNKTFREDLYWRINSFSSLIPPLRKRKEDIIPLAQYYLDKQNSKYHTNKIFYPQTLVILATYHWPGNVRELKNIIERIYILTGGNIIYDNHIPKEVYNSHPHDKKHYYAFDKIINQAEQEIIMSAYTFHGTITGVAQALNISKARVTRMIKRYSNQIREEKE
jgi:transcriptional regulator with PAS, ATPase and Fis domain